MKIEDVIAQYAEYKVELVLDKVSEPLQLQNKIKASYQKRTPFLIMAPASQHSWQGDLNPFSAERKFREDFEIEDQVSFFVINNEGNAHWNLYSSENSNEVIESSGAGFACGAYTFANIIRHSPQFQKIPKVQELLQWFNERYQIDLTTVDVNQLSPDKVRNLVAHTINNFYTELSKVSSQEQVDNQLQRILKIDSLLISDDLRSAFYALGIDFHEISNFRNPQGPEEIKVAENQLVNNLLKKSEKPQEYFDEERQGLINFLELNPEIKVGVDEILEFLKARESEIEKSQIISSLVSKRDYGRDVDDSSGDEEVANEILGMVADSNSGTREGGYDLQSQWQEFCATGGAVSFTESYLGLSEDEKEAHHLPFLMHAFGAGLLYCEKVNGKYYGREGGSKGLKEKYLYDIRKDGDAKKLVERNLEKVIARVAGLFLPNSTEESKKIIIQYIKDGLKGKDKEILTKIVKIAVERLVEYVQKNGFKGSDADLFYSKVKMKEVRKWQKANDLYKKGKDDFIKCTKFGWTIGDDGIWRLNKEWKLEKDGSLTQWDSKKKIVTTQRRRFYSRDGKILPYCHSTENKLISEKYDVEKLPEKTKKLLQRSFLNHVVTPLEKEGVIVENTTRKSAEKYPHQIVSSRWQLVRRILKSQNLHKAYAALMAAKSGNATLFEKLLEDGKVISAYFQDISNDFENNNEKELLKHFIEEMFHDSFLVRKTLPPNFATENIEDAIDFLAQIRLSNRSKKREIKNLRESAVRHDFLGKDAISYMKRLWRFNDGVYAEETQSISTGILAREAKVKILGSTNEGSYPALNKTIKEKLIAKFNKKYPGSKISDKDIAKWVRQKLKGEPLDIEIDLDIESLDVDTINRFVTEFTYLLFGCEVARNPAGLIAHNMMLDLIIAGKGSWEDFLGGDDASKSQKMPMAAVGAVQEARALGNLFGGYLPWNYKYSGEKSNVRRLMAAEKTLFDEWIEHKNINPEFAQEALFIACDDWFEIDMQRVIYSSSNQQDIAKIAIEKWVKNYESEENAFLEEDDFKLINDLIKKYGCQMSVEEKNGPSKTLCESLLISAQYDFDVESNQIEFFDLLVKNQLFDVNAIEEGKRVNLLESSIMTSVDSISELMIEQFSVEILNEKNILELAVEYKNPKICELLVSRGVAMTKTVAEQDFYKTNKHMFKGLIVGMSSMAAALSKVDEDMVVEEGVMESDSAPSSSVSSSSSTKSSPELSRSTSFHNQ